MRERRLEKWIKQRLKSYEVREVSALYMPTLPCHVMSCRGVEPTSRSRVVVAREGRAMKRGADMIGRDDMHMQDGRHA
jgi:hypothetical protein